MRDLFVRLMESVRGARRFHLDMLLPPTLAARALLAATLALPAGVQRFLGDGVLHNTPAGFRVVALSHVADGCAAHPGDPLPTDLSCDGRPQRSETHYDTSNRVGWTKDALGVYTVPYYDAAGHRTAECRTTAEPDTLPTTPPPPDPDPGRVTTCRTFELDAIGFGSLDQR